MPLSDTTLWPIEPHTKGKHLVLRSYLDAWLPILGSWTGRMLFIDGFAGPGEYKGGEEGSPQIALKALVEHSSRKSIKSEIGFVFIEKDDDRARHLDDVVNAWKPKLPSKCWTEVVNKQFDEVLDYVLEYVEEQNARLPPTFLMIDPFGVSGVRMDVIERVLNNSRCEIYISLMYEYINRFCKSPEFEPYLDSLYGGTGWRSCAEIEGSDDRRICFFNLYDHKLRESGAKYVLHFDLYRNKRFIYSIFFATQHVLGSDRMKAAIWKLDPAGNYEFRGVQGSQLALNLASPTFEPLKKALRHEFKGRGWVSIEQVTEFVQSDKTTYHRGQLKKKTLVPLENEGAIEIDENTRENKRSYPGGCMIRFL